MVSGRVAHPVGSIAFMLSMLAHLLLAAWVPSTAITEDVVGRGMPAYPGLFDPAFSGIAPYREGSPRVFGTNDTYAYVLIAVKFTSYGVALQTADCWRPGYTAVWAHFWLRLKPWFNAITPCYSRSRYSSRLGRGSALRRRQGSTGAIRKP